MSRWHAIRIRDDLYRVIQAQAAEMSRSATGQLDFVLSRALEQETGNSPGRAGQATGRSPSPARAPEWIKPPPAPKNVGETRRYWPKSEVEKIIEGQTTVDEMLASCPNCAGEMQDYCLDDGRGGGEMVKRCEDCGYVREGT